MTLGDDGVPTGTVREYSYAIILSQDCDLEQDYDVRHRGDESNIDKKLFGTLLCGVHEEDEIRECGYRGRAARLGSSDWKPIRQNMSPRYQYLGYVPSPNCTLVVDFKDYFFLPLEYLYEKITQEKVTRWASMEAPWRDHLLQRFGFYMTRIGLPTNFHDLTPPPAP